MNQIYRVIWNCDCGRWVVVSESVAAHGKPSRRWCKSETDDAVPEITSVRAARRISLRPLPLLLLGVGMMSLSALAQPPAVTALPTGGVVSAGQATISQSGSQMQIVQGSDKAALNWQSFDIGASAGVTFQQPSSQSVALNRVAGADPSQIYGTLNANGKLILINPNGVLFGQGSRVDAAGLIATTKALSDADFMNNNYRFAGGGTGVVRNDGTLVAAPDGAILLVADKVINTGTMQVRGGTIGMVSADELQVSGDWKTATVTGSATMNLSDVTVENLGRIDVSGLQGGQINLQGGQGTMQSNGELLAIGDQGKGGDIYLSGMRVGLMKGSLTDASGAAGGGDVLVGGDWQGSGSLAHAQATYMDADAMIRVNATGQGDGGKAVLWSDGYTNFRGQIQANGAGTGNGGQVETSGKDVLDALGSVTAQGVQAGEWLLDPSDIVISTTGTGTLTNGSYTPTGPSGSISNGEINNALNNGTTVILTTSGSIGGNGTVIQNADATIFKTIGGSATLIIDTNGVIDLQGSIVAIGTGSLNVQLGFSSDGAIILRGDIVTKGGYVNFNKGVMALGTTEQKITTGGGAVAFVRDLEIANPQGLIIDTSTGAANGGGAVTFGGKVDSGDTYSYLNSGGWNASFMAASFSSGMPTGSRFMAQPQSALENTIVNYTSGFNIIGLSAATDMGKWFWLGGQRNAQVFNTTQDDVNSATLPNGEISYQNWISGEPKVIGANSVMGMNAAGQWITVPGAGGGVVGTVVQTIAAASPLIVNAGGGAVTFADRVGSIKPLLSLTVTGPTAINGKQVTTEQGQTYNSPVSLGNVTSTLLESTKSSLQLDSPISFSFAQGTPPLLDIRAAQDITLKAPISTTNGALSVSMTADTDGDDLGAISINNPITTRGGSITLIASSGIAINGAALNTVGVSGPEDIALTNNKSGSINATTGGTIDAGSGNITVTNGTTGGIAGDGRISLQDITGAAVQIANNFTDVPAGQAAITLNSPIAGSGAVNVSSLVGDVLVSGNILSDSNANPSAIVVAAGTSKASMDNTGGDVKLLNNSKLIVNANSRAVVFTGSITGTQGVGAADAGYPGPGKYRYNVGFNDYSRSLDSTGTYVQYREQPTLNITLPSKVYDAIALNPVDWNNYLVTGWQNGDTAAINTLTGSLELNGSTTNEAKNVGNYAVAPGTIGDTLGYRLNFTGPYSITPAPLTVTGIAATKAYGADDPTLNYTAIGFVGGETSATALTGNLGRNPGESVALYGQTLGSLTANNGNYALTFTSANLTVTPTALNIVADAQTKSYGTDDPLLTYVPNGLINRNVQSYDAAGILRNVPLNDTAVTALTGNLGRQPGETIGNYAITRGSLAAANYTVTFTSADLAITPATLNIVADAQTKTYGTDDPTLTYVPTGLINRNVQSYDAAGTLQNVPLNDTAVTALTGNAGRQPGETVGNYAITRGSLAAANYTVTFTAADLTITPATLNIVADAQTKSYGTDDPTLTYVPTGLINRNVQSYDAAGTLQNVPLNDTAVTALTGNAGRQPGETIGNYAITRGSLAAANYTVTFTSADLAITPATLNIVADAQTKTYGTDDPTLTYVPIGLINRNVQSYDAAGTLQNVPLNDTAVTALTGNAGRQPGETIGNYAITRGSLAAANYTVTFTSADLAITPAVLNIVADAQTKTYGADDPLLTYVSNGAVQAQVQSFDATGNRVTVAMPNGGNTPNLTGNAGRQPGETIGNYAITRGSLAAANYTVTFTSADLAITPATLNIVADAQTKTYGTDDPTLTYVSTGLINRNVQSYDAAGTLQNVPLNDTAVTALTGNAGRQPGETIGNYAITRGSLAAANYTVTFTAADLTITPATLNIVADAQTKSYGTDDPTLTYVPTGLINRNVQSYDAAGTLQNVPLNDTAATALTGNAGRQSGETIGNYAITRGSLAAANYTVTFTSADLAITPATLNIVADAQTKTYGTDDPTLTYVPTGLINRNVQSYDAAGTLQNVPLNDTAVTALTGNLGRQPGETIGNYAITRGSLAAANYTVTFTSADLAITPAVLNIVADAQTKTYGADDPLLTYVSNGAVQAQVQSFDATGNRVTVAMPNGGNTPNLTGNAGRQPGETVGNYAITRGSLAAANYTVTFTSADLAITPATLNIVADAQTKTYGTDDPTLTYVPTGLINRNVQSYDAAGTLQNVPLNDTAVTALTGNAGRQPGDTVGNYAITRGSLASVNYAVTFTSADLTITPATLNIVADIQTKIYGTDDPTLTYSFNGTGLVNRTVQSYDAAGNVQNIALDDTVTGLVGNLGRQPGEAVGNYGITQGSLGSPNYLLLFTPVDLTISPAPLNIAADAQTKTYGTDDPTLTYVPTGLINRNVQSYDAAGTLQNVPLNDTAVTALTGNAGRQPGETIGNYAITRGSLAAANYTVTFTSADLAITPAVLNIVADAQTKTYGADDPLLTYVSNGAVQAQVQSFDATGNRVTVAMPNGGNTPNLTGNAGRQPGETIGNYAITRGSLAAANYTVTFTSADLAITPATLNIVADAQTKTYGTDDPTLTYVPTGLINRNVQSYDAAGTLQNVPLNDTAVTALTGNAGRQPGETVGNYAITRGSLASVNYAVTFTSADLTITPATLNIVADIQTKIYGTDDPTLTYSFNGTGLVNRTVQSYDAAGNVQNIALDDTVTGLVGNLGRQPGEAVGNYGITQGSLGSPNYLLLFTPVDLTISPAPLNIAADAQTKTYGTDDPTLTYVPTGLINRNVQSYDAAGTLQNVPLNDTAVTALTGNAGRQPGETIGNYAITRGSLAAANYTVTFTSADLAITPATLNIVADAQTKTYGTDDPTLTYVPTGLINRNVQSYDAAGTLQNVPLNDTAVTALTGNAGRQPGETVGNYAITRGSLASVNYAVTFTSADLTITPATLNIVADIQTKIYGTDDPTLTYSFNGTGLVNRTVQSYDAAGNVQNIALDDTVTGLVGNLGRQPGEAVGNYGITQGSLGSPNYLLLFTPVDLTISPAPLNIAADAQTKTYGTDDPTLTYVPTGLINRNVQSYDAAGTLQNVPLNDTAVTALTGNLGRQPGETIGNYAITRGSLAAANYTVTFTSADLAITPAVLNIVADAQTKTYGADDPLLTYVSNGAVQAQVQSFDATGNRVTVAMPNGGNTPNLTGNAGRQPGETIGNYAITRGSLAAANYTVTFTSADLAITPATLNIVADAQTKTYGTDDPTLTYVPTGLINRNVQSYDAAGTLQNVPLNDTAVTALTGNAGRQPGETVGNYAITRGSLASVNYAVTFTSADLTITPATLNIVANAQAKIYGTDDPTLTYSFNGTGLVNRTVQSYDAAGNVQNIALDDTVTGLVGNLGRQPGEAVGNYGITQGSLGSPNYLLLFTPVDLTISPAPLNIAADAQTKTYGTDDPTLTYVPTGLINRNVQSYDAAGTLQNVPLNDTAVTALTGNLGRQSGESVGDYGITLGSLTANLNNYDIAFTSANLTITRSTDPGAIINIAADDKTKVYGDSDPTLTYRVTNPSVFVNRTVLSYDAAGNQQSITLSDNVATALTGALARQPGEDVGLYGITQGNLAAQNYQVNYTGSDLEITPRKLTVSGLQVITRQYDSTTNAQITGGTLHGVLAGDIGDVVLNGATGQFADKNVGVNKAVQPDTALLSGLRAFNYEIDFGGNGLTGTITPAELRISGVRPQDRVYDGTVNASFTGTPTLNGVYANDIGNVSMPIQNITGHFSNKNAGANKIVVADLSTANLTGTEAGNYVIVGVDATVNSATVTPAPLRVTGTLASKLFDGSADSYTDTTVTGLMPGDSASSVRQYFNNAFPGKNKPLSILGGLAIYDGNNGNNYIIEGDIAVRGEIKGIPMISGMGGNYFMPGSKNLDPLSSLLAFEDIRQKSEQADYFLHSGFEPKSSSTHPGSSTDDCREWTITKGKIIWKRSPCVLLFQTYQSY